MNICLCNQKGGSGKTTLTLLLAMALENVGRKVAIVDRDPQATATRAIKNLRAHGLTKIEVVTKILDHDVVFFDTSPRIDEQLADTIKESDRVLLVSTPSPADLWSTQESRDVVQTNMKKDSKCALIFNSVVRSSKIAKDLKSLARLIDLPCLMNSISRKQSYQYAILQGWSILKPNDREEIKNAALEIGTMQ